MHVHWTTISQNNLELRNAIIEHWGKIPGQNPDFSGTTKETFGFSWRTPWNTEFHRTCTVLCMDSGSLIIVLFTTIMNPAINSFSARLQVILFAFNIGSKSKTSCSRGSLCIYIIVYVATSVSWTVAKHTRTSVEYIMLNKLKAQIGKQRSPQKECKKHREV